MIRIGPAGWSYPDWSGIVYPVRSRFDPLEYLSHFFDTIEINNTFYRPPAPETSQKWIQRVEHNPRFRFTLKLWQNFTHLSGELNEAEVATFREGILPLQESGTLGVLLVQFPWSFKNTDEGRARLVHILETFAQFPLAVEFRHRSWNQTEIWNLLHHFQVGVCNIDQPVIGQSLRPEAHVTSAIGYLRCHGRNYRNWFREGAGRDARYDYLYSDEEIEEQAGLVRKIAEKAKDVYAIYNNHFRGQAVVNAIQLRRKLEEGFVPIPGPLAETYPELKSQAQ
ncbi:MAG: DUF72 domain-containing protein [Acidobacteria bacterium]|nr:DUF72 domain-containing protein [Acidobacteriota bacterium]